eukprot:scaffold4097_cov166-Amphora_coffeaeformis.AAC.52
MTFGAPTGLNSQTQSRQFGIFPRLRSKNRLVDVLRSEETDKKRLPTNRHHNTRRPFVKRLLWMDTRRLLSHRLYSLEEVADEAYVTSDEELPSRTPRQSLSIDTGSHAASAQVTPAVVTPPSTSNSSNIPPKKKLMHRPKANGNQPTNQLSGQTSTLGPPPPPPRPPPPPQPVPATAGPFPPPPRSGPGPAATDGGANTSASLQNQQALFNYDDEVPVETDEPEQELSWRLDQIVSLSDWTIKVFNKETRQATSYYVHKNVLAVGPRKSEYFVRYFLSHDNMNSSQRYSDIWLERCAADCMPYFLDYIYSNDAKLEIHTGTAVGLRHLAQYFGNRVLHQKVMKFILGDLNMENVLVYYQHSVTVDDEKVTEITSQKCAENILDIDKKDELLLHIDPSFFRRIMGSQKIDSKEKQYHISLLLAEYCLLNKKHLDDQDFIRITADRYLPVVHHNAALTLMEMEADLVTNTDDNAYISSLQERCITDLTDHWREFSEMKQAEVLRVLRKVSSGVVADMFLKSLFKAKSALADVEKKLEEEQDEKKQQEKLEEELLAMDPQQAATTKKDYEKKIKAMELRHKKELDKLKSEYEKNLLKIRDVALEKEATIVGLKQDMERFQRMPNEPGGRLMQSGDQQQPDQMPTNRNYTRDGLVLSKPKSGGKYAVFFYDYNASVTTLPKKSGSNHTASTKAGSSTSSGGQGNNGASTKGGGAPAGAKRPKSPLKSRKQ